MAWYEIVSEALWYSIAELGDRTFGALEFILFLFSCIFILLSRDTGSNQCAIRARLGVAGHLSTTPRWQSPYNFV